MKIQEASVCSQALLGLEIMPCRTRKKRDVDGSMCVGQHISCPHDPEVPVRASRTTTLHISARSRSHKIWADELCHCVTSTARDELRNYAHKEAKCLAPEYRTSTI